MASRVAILLWLVSLASAVLIGRLLHNSFTDIGLAAVIGGLIGLVSSRVVSYAHDFRRERTAIKNADQVEVILMHRSNSGRSERRSLLLEFADDESVDNYLNATSGSNPAEVVDVRLIQHQAPNQRVEADERLIAAR